MNMGNPNTPQSFYSFIGAIYTKPITLRDSILVYEFMTRTYISVNAVLEYLQVLTSFLVVLEFLHRSQEVYLLEQTS